MTHLCYVSNVLSESEEIALGLTQMAEKEWEGNSIGEALDPLPYLTGPNVIFVHLSFELMHCRRKK